MKRVWLLTGSAVAVVAIAGAGVIVGMSSKSNHNVVVTQVASQSSKTHDASTSAKAPKKKSTSQSVKQSTSPPAKQASTAVPTGWTVDPTPIPLGANASLLTGVSCSSKAFCLADGETTTSSGPSVISVNYIFRNGRFPENESAETMPPNDLHPNPAILGPGTVSCLAGTHNACFIWSPYGSSDIYYNHQWYGPDPIPYITNADPMTGFSCPTTNFCMATDNQDNASFTYQNERWSNPIPVQLDTDNATGPTPRQSLSCATSSFCGAINNNGDAFVYDNGAWGQAVSLVPSSIGLANIACPTTGFCMATDNQGQAYTYNNGSWSHGVAIAGKVQYVNASALDCQSSNFCMEIQSVGSGSAVAGNQTTAYTYNGTAWTKNHVFANTHAVFDSVSCPTTTFCMAVGGQGSGSPTPYYATYGG